MSDHRIPGGIITLANIYRFEGVTFEFHSYCGPFLVHKKTFDPIKRTPTKAFYAMIERWQKLSPEKREETRIYG